MKEIFQNDPEFNDSKVEAHRIFIDFLANVPTQPFEPRSYNVKAIVERGSDNKVRTGLLMTITLYKRL